MKKNRDHAKKKHHPLMSNEIIESHISDLLTPLIFNEQGLYRSLGLRNRILNLSLMLASVLTLLWRNVPSVRELTKLLERSGFLWCSATKVSQKALSKRFLEFPAILLINVLKELLPQLQKRWELRQKRPLPDSVSFALSRYQKIWVLDCSTLEALFRKLGSLEEVKTGKLAGKMGVVIDLVTRLPVEIWLKNKASISDIKFEDEVLDVLKEKTLLLIDRGFYHFQFWQELIDRKVDFITRTKKGISFQVKEVFTDSYSLRDRLIEVGSGRNKTPILTLRLVEIRSNQKWHSYLTSVVDPRILPLYVVADLYGKRWQIETAFNTVKRLLDLSYLWTGSMNGIELQVGATWLFYSILIDLGDGVANELSLPLDSISLEMLYRGFYHFIVAYDQGKATDIIKYFADPKNQDLGIVKSQRKPSPLRPPYQGGLGGMSLLFLNNRKMILIFSLKTP